MGDIVDYHVYKVEISGGITVDYSIQQLNGRERRMRVKLYEKAHEDFYKAYEAVKECFYQMFGLPLVDAETGEKLEVALRKVTFVSKTDYGQGMKITAEVKGIMKHSVPMKFTTLPYYETALARFSTGELTECGSEIYCHVQQLTGFQLAAMQRFQQEAFYYAQYGKKEQPTLEEAAEGYFLEQGSNE